MDCSPFISEHTWICLVGDCLGRCCLGISCLGYDNDCGASRKPGYSVLKTSLILNNIILKDEGLCLEKNTDSCIVSRPFNGCPTDPVVSNKLNTHWVQP